MVTYSRHYYYNGESLVIEGDYVSSNCGSELNHDMLQFQTGEEAFFTT
ncbi:hypothetical protein HXA35_18880 [Bacillus sp. A301a_S52]|nr:hypothetical protein [Bacillus sp. A301a_S52]